MSWKEQRTLTLLSSILAALFAVLLIVLGIRYRETRAELEALNKVEEDTEVVVEEPVYFSNLTYYNGKTTLTFSLNEEGHWIWSDDPSFPLDESVVLSVLAVLEDWQPRYTLDDEDAFKGAELYRPTGTLTATTSEGTVVTLLFGKPTDDGTAHYVRVNNEENRVHVVPDSVYDLLCVPIYDMMVLPELPVLSENSLSSIRIQGAAPVSILTAQQTEDGGTVSWRHAGANVTDAKLTRNLMAELETLSLKKCVLYRPSEAASAICGFEAPMAELCITYAGEEETRTLELTVGTALPDGSGYYVRLGADDTIYLVEAAALKTAMSISSLGMESAAQILAIMEGASESP